ncbi:hypothetical protein BH20ACT2_BH20ACT2_15170 [soil metagenome]
MRRFAEVVGQKVMSAGSAEQLGTVRGLVVDATAGRIVSVRVKGADPDFCDWSELHGVGPDAVVASGAAALRPARPGVEEREQAGDGGVLGKRALTDGGTELGVIADIEFDESSGALEAIVVGDDRIAADRLRSIGGYAAIIRAD